MTKLDQMTELCALVDQAEHIAFHLGYDRPGHPLYELKQRMLGAWHYGEQIRTMMLLCAWSGYLDDSD